MGQDHSCNPIAEAIVEKSTNKELILRIKKQHFQYKPQHIQIISNTFKGGLFQEEIIAEKQIDSKVNDFSIEITIDISKNQYFQSYLDDLIKKSKYSYEIWIAGWYYSEDRKKELHPDFKQQTKKYFKQTIPLNLEKAESKPKKNFCSLIYFTQKALALYFDWAAFVQYKPTSVICEIRVQGKDYQLGEVSADQTCANFDLANTLSAILEKDFCLQWDLKLYGIFGNGNFKGEPRTQKIQKTKSPNHPYDLDFSSEQKMLEQIASLKDKLLDSKKKLNVILYGPSASGKSALINTINYVLYGMKNDSKSEVKNNMGVSGTDRLHVVDINKYITFYDLPGLEENNEDNNDDERRKFWDNINIMDYAKGELEEGLKSDGLKEKLYNRNGKIQFNFVLFMSFLSGKGFYIIKFNMHFLSRGD